jgi:hypothetical protein
MPTADITAATEGRKGRSLASTFGTLAKQVSTERAAKRAARPEGAKKDKKGSPTPDDICAALLPMLRSLITNPPTASAFSPVESAVGDIVSAILAAGSNRNARTGAA